MNVIAEAWDQEQLAASANSAAKTGRVISSQTRRREAAGKLICDTYTVEPSVERSSTRASRKKSCVLSRINKSHPSLSPKSKSNFFDLGLGTEDLVLGLNV